MKEKPDLQDQFIVDRLREIYGLELALVEFLPIGDISSAKFYQGYGAIDINLIALTYYRYERIVSDMAEFCQQILLTTEGGADLERSLRKFHSIFLPNQVLEIAYQTDQILKRQYKDITISEPT